MAAREAVDDWNLMFDAVKARLRSAAAAGHDSAAMASTVLECVEALELLQRMLEPQGNRP